jgi:hypothetical protein
MVAANPAMVRATSTNKRMFASKIEFVASQGRIASQGFVSSISASAILTLGAILAGNLRRAQCFFAAARSSYLARGE